jgi:hypothetical protein
MKNNDFFNDVIIGVFWFWVLSRKESKSCGVFECVSEKE